MVLLLSVNSDFYIKVHLTWWSLQDGHKESSKTSHYSGRKVGSNCWNRRQTRMKGRKQTLCLGGRGGVTTALWTANIILALLLTRCVTLEMPPVVSYFLSLGPQGKPNTKWKPDISPFILCLSYFGWKDRDVIVLNLSSCVTIDCWHSKISQDSSLPRWGQLPMMVEAIGGNHLRTRWYPQVMTVLKTSLDLLAEPELK